MDRLIRKKKWSVKKILSTLGAGILVLFLLYSLIFAGKASKLNVDVDKITVAKVRKGEFREFIPVDGNVMPIKTIHLDAIEGGIIEKKFYEGGILVEKGDTIIKLANINMVRDFINQETQAYRLINELENTRLALKQNSFDLRRTLNDLDYRIDAAEERYERGKKLFADGVISQQEISEIKRNYNRLIDQREIEIESKRFEELNAKTQIEHLQKTLERTNRNLKFARENLENLYIKAPIPGRLSAVYGEVGESIDPGQNLGQIDDLNGFKVRASINEHYISRIYEGLNGEFDFAGETYQLKISKVYPEVTNGLFEVDMKFVGDIPEGIRRGQTLQIKLQLSEDVEAVMIPRGSFYQTTGGNWIFVVDDSGDLAEKRNIQLGRQNPRYYEVSEGLEPGEKVVVSSYNGYEDTDQLVLKD